MNGQELKEEKAREKAYNKYVKQIEQNYNNFQKKCKKYGINFSISYSDNDFGVIFN